MKSNLTALLAGLIFGLGLTVSQMVNPDKVLSFLDIFGDWDPSLALVMGSALIVTALGYFIAGKRDTPLFAKKFEIPGKREIDAPLAIGAVLFGVGWGLVGLCPGPAISAFSLGGLKVLGFFAAMASGMVVFECTKRFWTPES
jgi:uncharacterized membrane protein YedE/YeeE